MAKRDGSKPNHAIINTGLLLFLVLLPAAVYGGHFPAPNWDTMRSANYLVNLKIEGIDAALGDEIAFFNPRGVISGLHVITALDDYYMVTVYGDSQAVNGEELTVKIWDASAETELSGSALILAGGAARTDYYQSSSIPPVWRDNTGSVLNIDTTLASHYPFPVQTPESSSYIGDVNIMGEPAPAGDEVAVFDAAGVLRGSTRITTGGKFSVAVYKPSIAGVLNFKVWDTAAGMEYSGNSLVLKPGDALGDWYIPAPLPPTWQDNVGYVLNIDVLSIAPGDVNGDGQVNLADVILALQALTGQPAASSSALKQADVNGDMKIGLEELIFVLQKAAQLR